MSTPEIRIGTSDSASSPVGLDRSGASFVQAPNILRPRQPRNAEGLVVHDCVCFTGFCARRGPGIPVGGFGDSVSIRSRLMVDAAGSH